MAQRGRQHDTLSKVDYQGTKNAWFTHAGKVYPVISAPTSVFRAAVMARSPQWKKCAEYIRVLKQDEIDYTMRWWLLNSLADRHREIVLYASRDDAEQACCSFHSGEQHTYISLHL